MSSWFLFVFALIGALLVANATWPTRGAKSLLPSWIGVFLTVDLAFHHIALHVIVVAFCYWLGAFEAWPARIGVAILVIIDLQLLRLWLPNLQAASVAEKTASDMQLDVVEPVPRSLMLSPFARSRKGVEVVKDVEFSRVAGRILKLDVYRPETNTDNRPALVYVHGGGWLFGDKREQGLPLCLHMATLGWVCFNVNYRLSPGATWPDHLVDVKAAIAWIREHAADYGVDRSFIAIAGGSAGGHIAAMAALTPGREDLQPGFEGADTSVQAAVPSYAVLDLTNRLGAHRPEFLTNLVGPHVLKAFPDTEPGKFSAASPRDFCDQATQPWLLLQGDADTLTPVVEAREFFEHLDAGPDTLTGYAEFPGAAHAFDIYYSPRTNAAVNLTARFLATVHSRAP